MKSKFYVFTMVREGYGVFARGEPFEVYFDRPGSGESIKEHMLDFLEVHGERFRPGDAVKIEVLKDQAI